ncbi:MULTISPECIES: DNA polymerase III subunit beta [unclassified Clostridium]|uniref:DNA polymerase III subunit beta n=1 Tax=unclassified Clostridium TaxID=2614128 RepID=UPI00207A7607|nr:MULTISPECIES: DNA polymerase III subunit beta [unclassified Clostridium]
MKTILEIKELQKAIKEVNKIKKNEDFELSEIIEMSASDGHTYLIKDNFQTRIKKKINSEMIENGSIGLDSATIKLLLKLKNNEITFSDNEIKTGKKIIKFVNQGTVKREYQQEKIDSFEVTEKELLRMLEVNYTCATDEARPILQGVCFKDNETCAVDGYRLSKRTTSEYDFDGEFVLKNESIKVLKSLLDAKKNSIVQVDIFDKEVVFSFNDTELTCKIMDGKFVNYKGIIPSEDSEVNALYINDIAEMMDSLMLINEIKVVDKKGNKKQPTVMLSADDEKKLVLSCKGVSNSITDVMEKNSYTIYDSEICFNSKYLIEGLKIQTQEKIYCTYATRVSPMVVSNTDENFENIELILPIRQMQ